MKAIGRVVVCSMLLFVVAIHKTYAVQYEFVSIRNLSEQEVGRIVLHRIYDRLDIPITITPLPGRRAEQDVVSGRKDGEIMRIWSYGENNDSVIRVPTPYYYLQTTAFVQKGQIINIREKDDLKAYRLVKVRGVRHTDDFTKGMRNVLDFNSSLQMLSFLSAGRADIALTNYLDGMLTIYKHDLVGKVVPLERSLARFGLYHYLHNSHADLVPKIDQVIKEMKASGELETLIRFAEFTVIEDYTACERGTQCLTVPIEPLPVETE
ncbi:substrate-binding periplasmic protein [Agaribacter flavus]|uniref:Substrate-binding periplasmic protein n=1 Tax=Agaribacter flavus TaxID=1902781 RepID=A0ABV7FSF2_9ALTE